MAEKVQPLTSGDYQYIVLEDNTAEITKYIGKAKALTVKDTLDGLTVTSIGDEAFSWCSSLTSISLPDSLTSIGDGAFARCSSLTSISLPDSAQHMGSNPFAYCEKLNTVSVSPDHPFFATIDGVLFEKQSKKLVWYPMSKNNDTYAVPNGIREIGDLAFSSCSSLTSISLPDSVTSIGDEAFSGCFSLTSISLPDSLTSIGDDAFSNCPNLTLTVPRDSYAKQYCIDNNLP